MNPIAKPIHIHPPRQGRQQFGAGEQDADKGPREQERHYFQDEQGNEMGFEEERGYDFEQEFVDEEPGREAPMSFEYDDWGEEGEEDLADIDMADVLEQDGGRARGGEVGGTLGARRN
ncbi:hypothetical protein E6O75_ATG10891 [Venturia nashicola]|uniref:Uncharacterized protein n=1 Tax=Venturia nashicola TaxID=86259 RepID=A0A4Z1P0X0_9PEZI|nr:hypothetical protein E6O75_ATG10891 [Venturia nashicola]